MLTHKLFVPHQLHFWPEFLANYLRQLQYYIH